jgi:hypothetical protein
LRQSAPSPSGDERPAESGPGDAERQLAIMLAGTAQRRAERSFEIQRLAAVVDYGWLIAALGGARLLPLLGSRLVAAAPHAVPDQFRDALESALTHSRRRAALVEQVALRLLRGLEDEGIGVVALKGPHLAERLHGDAGMRTSVDIDLLVQPEDFHSAVEALERTGYRSEDKAPWLDGLPLFEASLRRDDAWHPSIDLHWRLHWYEEAFSRRFIHRCEPDERGVRVPGPLDELAALLLFWTRDGLAGLRHAADIGAWWDRHGHEIEPGALDDLAAAHPPLRRAFAAAALHAEQVVGVLAGRLLPGLGRGERRVRLAGRCANLAHPGTPAQGEAAIVLTDILLTPRGGGAALLRRHLALPAEVIAEIYELPPRARARRAVRRGYYAVRVGARLGGGSAQILRRALRVGPRGQ